MKNQAKHDSKYYDLSWDSKIENLYHIAQGLYSIHQVQLVHKDFHSGNIVNENFYYSYITDFGLCKPISQVSNSNELFAYVAPELLRASTNGDSIVYTQKSDIFSYRIIISEIFNGYPPYYNIPHDLGGQRPKIKCEVPQLLLDLMNRCLDDKPKNRC
ncbi:kinase-like domain-containing protein [Gigaspora rosea]|uniref:Kinase-like domain-containing protein n=1 Tax=Gigaspora rosea TaxID=44941 RepID=A0A397V725_9GLOM|nr:kinase-like domain-containing protein [Gigaspora rosea]